MKVISLTLIVGLLTLFSYTYEDGYSHSAGQSIKTEKNFSNRVYLEESGAQHMNKAYVTKVSANLQIKISANFI
jgi:hypothetical protein